MSVLTTVRGDRIAYDDSGPADAPAVVFITGAGPDRAGDPTTRATAELLAAQGIRSLFADRLGRGESVSNGPITLDAQLAAIAELAAISRAPIAFVGHSSGCALAMLAAARVPNVAGMFLWEAPLGLFPEGAAAWWASVRESIDAGDLEAAVARYMAGMPPEWLDALKQTPEYPRIVLGWVPDGEALAAVEQRGYATSAPLVALTATETFPGMVATADALAAAAATGTSERMPGSDHAWNADAMAQRLADFLHPLS
ncbi:alpha/beta hydrolase [Microbacterium esteraromaticum]|uniref:alpha/beta fold hydrolase n=1 Tax=Microbacterium esteraromaticum TaxID=57043 RepID=UPI002367B727|nr:alpha/beta hydrolase [Microbacterium esteraromaticum]WDH78690.1 alpha/beta hydrolase [Microbacterium esteraromaticum]